MVERCTKARLSCAIFSDEPANHACALLRVVQPLARVSEEVTFESIHSGSSTTQTRTLAVIDSADIVIVQRLFPCRKNRSTLDTILRANKPVLYETDDLLDDLPAEHYLHDHSRDNRTILTEFVRRCDAVTVSTGPLAAAYRAYNDDVTVLPNCLDPKHWMLKSAAQTRPAQTDAPIVIGFFGTGSHKPDLALVESALLRLAERHAGRVAFRFLGCITPTLAGLPECSYAEQWCTYDAFPALVAREQIDIGIAPLVDSPLNRCKSDLKWLEYSALGIPGVFSRVAPYARSVRDGETGLLVENNPDDWFQALDRLVRDAALRKRIAEAAHAEVRATRTLETGAPRFLATLKRAAALQPRPDRADRIWDMVMRYEDTLAEQAQRLSRLESELAWVENSLPRRLLRQMRSLLRPGQSLPR